MLTVTPAAVGAEGYARMARDGVIVPVLPGVAVPRDIALTTGLRRHVLASIAPAGTQVTALAALWACGCAPTPWHLEVRCGRPAPRRQAHSPLPVIAHVMSAPQEPEQGAVATPDRACADALAWSSLDLAVPAVLCAVGSGLVTLTALRGDDHSGEGLDRVERALQERSRPRPAPLQGRQGRLVPVMRRAS